MSRNSAVPTLTPTFLAVTPPRRMYPGYPLPRYELPKNTPLRVAPTEQAATQGAAQSR
ncbi:hypothetical protein LJR071_002268 [Pseudomonas sp. LjRoot71]|jgi:hypothetical protein|uniref:hypothetical protein n=1 Tax=Pseudomonas sp. LjRoot71 TaxID=3342336 RepID=UPI003ECCE1EA